MTYNPFNPMNINRVVKETGKKKNSDVENPATAFQVSKLEKSNKLKKTNPSNKLSFRDNLQGIENYNKSSSKLSIIPKTKQSINLNSIIESTSNLNPLKKESLNISNNLKLRKKNSSIVKVLSKTTSDNLSLNLFKSSNLNNKGNKNSINNNSLIINSPSNNDNNDKNDINPNSRNKEIKKLNSLKAVNNYNLKNKLSMNKLPIIKERTTKTSSTTQLIPSRSTSLFNFSKLGLDFSFSNFNFHSSFKDDLNLPEMKSLTKSKKPTRETLKKILNVLNRRRSQAFSEYNKGKLSKFKVDFMGNHFKKKYNCNLVKMNLVFCDINKVKNLNNNFLVRKNKKEIYININLKSDGWGFNNNNINLNNDEDEEDFIISNILRNKESNQNCVGDKQVNLVLNTEESKKGLNNNKNIKRQLEPAEMLDTKNHLSLCYNRFYETALKNKFYRSNINPVTNPIFQAYSNQEKDKFYSTSYPRFYLPMFPFFK
jgi:hypothetical protein